MIDKSQIGIIRGRYIRENIRILFEIIENIEEQNKPDLIFADFEKAFEPAHEIMVLIA